MAAAGTCGLEGSGRGAECQVLSAKGRGPGQVSGVLGSRQLALRLLDGMSLVTKHHVRNSERSAAVKSGVLQVPQGGRSAHLQFWK